jgi:serine phosphatase RsbU (regulator of sigma subunit)
MYTDGATEAHDRNDQMLGIEGLQRALLDETARTRDNQVSEQLLRDIQRFRSGPPEDDILIVELSRGRAECAIAAEEVTSK